MDPQVKNNYKKPDSKNKLRDKNRWFRYNDAIKHTI